MDVFGAIANTIDLADKIVIYIQAVKGAKEDRRKLNSEISALGGLLKILHSRLTNNNDSTNTLVMAGIRDPLLRCYQDLGRTVEELERIASSPNTGKSSPFLERMKDITWPFRQEDVKSTLARIERLKSLISLALQTSLMKFVGETRNELKNVGLNVEEIEVAVGALDAAQQAHMKETRSIHANLRNLVDKFQDSADGIAKIKDRIDTIGRNQNDYMMKGDQMQADLTIIKESVYNQELQDLVKWLSPLDFGEKHHTLFEKRTRDTGEWFLNHSKFLAWRRGDPGYKTLWCPGNPGVGKSVMVSLVINELGKAIPENVALIFIYFEYKTRYTLSQLAEVILKQLLSRRITRSVLESLQKYKAGIRPTSDELFDMLKIEVGTYDHVLVVIDALDEADVDVWTRLLGRLQALREVRLIATSRDTGEIELGLPPYQRLNIMFNEGDMRKYIEGRLESSIRFKQLLKKGVDIHEIVTGVMKKADGMFLLAQLHMNSLETKLNVRDLRRALDELPDILDATYDEAMSRISNDYKALAYRIISWLIHAARPMTICDLQYALAVEEGMTAPDNDNLYDGSSLTSICVGLVVLREDTAPKGASHHTGNKIVGFVHYTTQEYFLHSPSVSAQFGDSPNFAITCLRCLAFDIFKTGGPPNKEQLMETPFAEYAMLFWGVHARTHCEDKSVKDLAMELLHDGQRVVAVGSLPCRAENPSTIHLCTHFGLKDYLEYFLDHGCDINSRDSEGDTVVSYAALNGQEEIMRLLLEREGVDVNPHNNFRDTPIIIAARMGHGSIVELLLARGGVDINLRGWDGQTPLSIAAYEGHEAIVRLLLARDDLDVNLRDYAGDIPITKAAWGGHRSIVELLLARDGVDINSRGWRGRTPLSFAAGQGHEAIVRLLLARDDLDVNLRDNHVDIPVQDGHSKVVKRQDGLTPLSIAVREGREAIVQLLLARDDIHYDVNTLIIDAVWGGNSGIMELLLAQDGVDINSRGQDGRTVLSVAAREGREAIVQLLLERDDLDVSARDDVGDTPIVGAAGRGHSGIVKLLLARDGVDINSHGRWGDTPLSLAARRGHEAIVRLLLARDDLDVDPHDNDEDTPIIEAAQNGHSGIVELLLARGGVNINCPGFGRRTPLSVAASQGHEAIVRLLLAKDDLDINLRDDHGNTPIIGAARGGHDSIVELLLARGVDINSHGQYGYTPLSVAAGEGHETTVRLLLARDGLDVNPRDDYRNTPIMDAAQGGHSGIVKLLLAQDGVDINLRGRNGRTLLSVAARQGHEAIVRLLLVRDDLDINPRDDDGDTLIINAAWGGNSGIMELLLTRDVDINSRGQDGYTPLSVAARRGHEAIVRLLLARDDLDVDPHDNDEDTPIIEAARNGHSGIVELLLERDVDINSRGQSGYTALSAAIYHRRTAVVQLLLAKADPDGAGWRDDDGNTYLALATYRNNEEATKWLMAKASVDINLKISGGNSLLSLAASRPGNDAIVKLLLDQDGIDVNPVNLSGRTPLDYALRWHFQRTIELLRAAGGCTGRELGVEPREDEGSEEEEVMDLTSTESDDTTEDGYMTADEDRSEDGDRSEERGRR